MGERFSGVDLTSSDQHLISDSRVQRDNDDCRKMVEWFKHYNPFETSNLISLSTGVAGDSKRINCHTGQGGRNSGQTWFPAFHQLVIIVNICCLQAQISCSSHFQWVSENGNGKTLNVHNGPEELKQMKQ
ncbi:hypothetical protein AVEN_40379-1 [Araneus ventricosus]|uniref:Uncharacterized protein n=1 Tax=Araneus ventricosus TaxID=182803 RepID=A0A4Y2IRK8_ARAVE|nr:hypothetical protein AVEN_40379-1 [Araneus ventricosus]